MEAVYPSAASALARGRRRRRREPRERRRTMPVTFAEIKEVDEEGGAGSSEGLEPSSSVTGMGMRPGSSGSAGEERRRRVDVIDVDERLGRQFAEFRRRRATLALRELSPPEHCDGPAPAPVARALSEPDALHRHDPPVCTNTTRGARTADT